jgi:hypothetical protein
MPSVHLDASDKSCFNTTVMAKAMNGDGDSESRDGGSGVRRRRPQQWGPRSSGRGGGGSNSLAAARGQRWQLLRQRGLAAVEAAVG